MTAAFLRTTPTGLELDVLVSPRASRVRVGPISGDRLKVAVTAPPVDGEANAEVIEAVADALGIPKRSISVLRGGSSRRKTLFLSGASLRQAQAHLLGD